MYKPGASLPRKNLGRDDRRDGPIVRLGLLPLFLLLWAVPGFLLRAVVAWRQLPDTIETGEAILTVALRTFTALPQDLLVAVECLALVWLVRKALTNRGLGERGPIIVGGVATALYVGSQFLVFADYLFFTKAGLRLDASIVRGLPPLATVRGILLVNGLMPLLCGVGTLLTLGMYVGQYVRALKPRHSLTSTNLSWMAVIAVAGGASWWFTPEDDRYWSANVLIKEQGNTVWRAATKKASKRPPLDEAQCLTGCRGNEQSAPLSPAFPLYKDTQAFTGAPAFQLNVASADRPHVVFLQLEGFRGTNVGALGAKRTASPHFDSLSKRGVLFTQFYANGVQPGAAAVASLYGVWPRFATVDSTHSQPNLPLVGLPHLLRDRGYRTTYVNGRIRDLEVTTEFYKQHGFEDVHGVNEMLETVPNGGRSAFGVHDEVLVQHLVEWLKRQDKLNQPTFVFATTNTNRRPWQVPGSFQPPRSLPSEPGEVGEYLRSFQYSDACLGAFVRLLKDAKLDSKTILVIYGSAGVAFDSANGSGGLSEDAVRVPLLILAPGRLERPVSIAEVASQVDLLPTCMDLLGLTGPNHAVGTTLVRHHADRRAFLANPFAAQGLGVRLGDWKYVYRPQAREGALYNLTTDPQESQNVAGEQSELVERLHAQVLGLNTWMSRMYLRETIMPRTEPRPGKAGN